MMCVYKNDQYLVYSVAFNFKDKHILQNNDIYRNIILKVIIVVFLFKRQTLFTFHDHIIDIQIFLHMRLNIKLQKININVKYRI